MVTNAIFHTICCKTRNLGRVSVEFKMDSSALAPHCVQNAVAAGRFLTTKPQTRAGTGGLDLAGSPPSPIVFLLIL